jgi:hypothetical protein
MPLHSTVSQIHPPSFVLRRSWLWGALAIVPMGTAWAQVAAAGAAEAASQTFTLGTVEVSARREAEELGAGDMQRVGSAEMERSNASTVADAVRNLPGVSLSRNNRNEEMISLRGFDSRQVPIFVDGVPLYVPYDGYVDLGRFTTFDLAEINVAKAGASLLYGPNTLGGAVNLVTRKPVKPFEGDVRLGVGSGGERRASFNLGGNQGTGTTSWVPPTWMPTAFLCPGASGITRSSPPIPAASARTRTAPTSACPSSWDSRPMPRTNTPSAMCARKARRAIPSTPASPRRRTPCATGAGPTGTRTACIS